MRRVVKPNEPQDPDNEIEDRVLRDVRNRIRRGASVDHAIRQAARFWSLRDPFELRRIQRIVEMEIEKKRSRR